MQESADDDTEQNDEMRPTSPIDGIIEQNSQLTPTKQKFSDTKKHDLTPSSKHAPEPPRKRVFSDTNNEAAHVSAAYGVILNDSETDKENIIPHKELSGSMKRKRKVMLEELSARLFEIDNLSNISISEIVEALRDKCPPEMSTYTDSLSNKLCINIIKICFQMLIITKNLKRLLV